MKKVLYILPFLVFAGLVSCDKLPALNRVDDVQDVTNSEEIETKNAVVPTEISGKPNSPQDLPRPTDFKVPSQEGGNGQGELDRIPDEHITDPNNDEDYDGEVKKPKVVVSKSN